MKSAAILRWLLLVPLLVLVGVTIVAQEAQPDPYVGLSDAEARSKFQRSAVALRLQQREALRAASAEFERLANQSELDPSSVQTLRRLVHCIDISSDLPRVLESALQDRRNVDASVQPALDAETARLTEHWQRYQEYKLQYQLAVGRSLAQSWDKLPLEEKRCQLADYLALADEHPSWLLRNSPVDIVQLVPKSVMPPIDQYLSERNDLIQRARDELKPSLERLCQLSQRLASDESLTDFQRKEAAAIAELIEAPYAHGLGGVLLCLPGQELPDRLRTELESALKAVLFKIERMQPVHAQLLRDLHTRLESGQSVRLKQGKLTEQMAIDLYLAKVTHLVHPMRVFANRVRATEYYESARLLEVRLRDNNFQYRVELLADGVTQWVDRDQVVTRPSAKLTQRMHIAVPSGGPGQSVTHQTDLRSGQVYAFSAAGWKPVYVIDESALGVVVVWQGPAEPIEFCFARSELRIVP